MTDTVSDLLLQPLRARGVEPVFACPDDRIDSTLGAFGRQTKRSALEVQPDELPAFQASAHAERVAGCAAWRLLWKRR